MCSLGLALILSELELNKVRTRSLAIALIGRASDLRDEVGNEEERFQILSQIEEITSFAKMKKSFP